MISSSNGLHVIKNFIDIKTLSRILLITDNLNFIRQRKNRFAKSWSSSMSPNQAQLIFDLIGLSRLQKINSQIRLMDLPFKEKSLLKLEVSELTCVYLSPMTLPLAWHRDSYLNSKGIFVGPKPYSYKLIIALNDITKSNTTFAPFCPINKSPNSEIKSILFSLTDKSQKIQFKLKGGDAQLFRTDILHKRPFLFLGERKTLIFCFNLLSLPDSKNFKNNNFPLI
ncbi:hypothetical protein MCEHALH13_00894 [Candidatus Methylopumilus universalis]|uniref:hypothetical protein n=1 Tax=Candidatus Methylopumilus universalis TaxID=2588536 RepID=UPI003BEF1BE9